MNYGVILMLLLYETIRLQKQLQETLLFLLRREGGELFEEKKNIFFFYCLIYRESFQTITIILILNGFVDM